MPRRTRFFAVLLPAAVTLALAGAAPAQQVPDPKFRPVIAHPEYPPGKGPLIAIDGAHHNFHTAKGGYRPFAEFLRGDGYRVKGLDAPLSAASLRDVDVLVIANALHESNARSWTLPTPSAFTPAEIAALRSWIEKGGSLLLIADHMPFAGAATELADTLGVRFSNGYAQSGNRAEGQWTDIFNGAAGLQESPVTRGRTVEEQVTSVTTFTGSAFQPPPDAIPVLRFGPGSVSLETKQAPQITPDAPRVPVDGWCQGALLKIGRGRVAVFGEAAMFTAQLAGPQLIPIGMNAPEAGQNRQLLLNVMHWLSRAKGMAE